MWVKRGQKHPSQWHRHSTCSSVVPVLISDTLFICRGSGMDLNPRGKVLGCSSRRLAGVYVRAVERGGIVRGLTFDIANEFTESADDILTTLCGISGARRYETGGLTAVLPCVRILPAKLRTGEALQWEWYR